MKSARLPVPNKDLLFVLEELQGWLVALFRHRLNIGISQFVSIYSCPVSCEDNNDIASFLDPFFFEKVVIESIPVGQEDPAFTLVHKNGKISLFLVFARIVAPQGSLR